ncbi:MAG: sigma-70 family RNA polymerase sigma factor [Planctomycetes bacterium]|nr:sigma-70 family RNA polymerase sigma factor [Planctomycetota bacterium]
MGNKDDYIKLVEKAQLGDKESMNLLAQLARERLRVFAYRLTLREDLSQDIVQESMLEMFKVLGKLKRADRFWPWIYTITYNKIRRHWRTEKRHKSVSIGEMDFGDDNKQNQGGLENLVAKELKEVVLSSMKQLKDSHRAVLTMRCYDNMKYSEIAELMGSSELGARMLFLRAKKSLGKHLSRRGLGSGALLTALVVFGKVTAPTKAAAAQIAVTAATTQVGVTASVIGVVASKATLLTLTAAGAIAVGTNVFVPDTGPVDSPAQQHITAMTDALPTQSQLSESIEDRWDFYPEGRNGPLMSRLVIYDEDRQNAYCQWLQDDNCNYFYDKSNNIVYKNNFRTWSSDHSVPVLTTDKPEMVSFLRRVQVISPDFRHIIADGDGLLVMSVRDNTINSSNSRTIRHKNAMQEDYFQYVWAEGTDFVDNRDQIHRQGWCFFRVKGEMAGAKVTGSGRLPLFYKPSKVHRPWLKLTVESPDGLLLIFDTSNGAVVVDEDRGMITYPAGSFFKGLSRQWMGLHTIDSVRRDAAENEISFLTEYTDGQVNAEVSVLHGNTTAVYTIDMEKDLIDKIEFKNNSLGDLDIGGFLEFTYLHESHLNTPEFTEPVTKPSRRWHQDSLGISWLSQLAEGKLAD